MNQQTLSIIKPDATKRNINGAIRIEPDAFSLTLRNPAGSYNGPFTFNGGTTLYGDDTSVLVIGEYDWTFGGSFQSGLLVTSETGTDVDNIYPVVDYPQRPTKVTTITGRTITPPIDNLTTTLTFNSSVPINTVTGDKITFQLQEILNGTSENYTASVSIGSLTVAESSAAQGVYPYATTASSAYIIDFNNDIGGNLGQITMSADLSSFYQNYQQVPYFTSGSSPIVTYSSSLYNQYGDINTVFNPQPYDKIILQDKNGIIQDLDIYTASFSGGQLRMQTYPQILNTWASNTALVQKFLLLRRFNDEQNVILTYNKPNGATSYGFLLPNTVNPTVVNNINTLQANVQAQLLSTQANSNISNI
jgi:hypothetical protein